MINKSAVAWVCQIIIEWTLHITINSAERSCVFGLLFQITINFDCYLLLYAQSGNYSDKSFGPKIPVYYSLLYGPFFLCEL